MSIDLATIATSGVVSGVVSMATASVIAGRSERGKQAADARRAVREAVSPLLTTVTRHRTEKSGGYGREGNEHHLEDLAFAYRVRVAADSLSRLRLSLVRRRLRRLVGAQWMDGIERGDLTQYSEGEASRIFANVIEQTVRSSTEKPAGLIPVGLEAKPYSKDVNKLLKNLRRLASSR